MRFKHLTFVAVAIASLALTGCAHEAAGGRNAGMMKAGSGDCGMRADHDRMEGRAQDHDRRGPAQERETAARGNHGQDKDVSGCGMMGPDNKPSRDRARAPGTRDPHADHRP